MSVEKRLCQFLHRRQIEDGPAMTGTGKLLQGDIHSGIFQCIGELHALRKRHQSVGGSMQNEDRGVVFTHIMHGADGIAFFFVLAKFYADQC